MEAENELNKNEPDNTIPIIPDSTIPGTVSKQDLENTIKDITQNFHTKPEDIAEYIKFSSRFYNYSTRNTMLIYKQNPGALFCGSFKRFKERLSILSHETGHAQLHSSPEALNRPTPQVEFEADCFSIMFSTYAGVEVAETRCRHLTDCYKEMTGLKDFKPEMLQQSLNRAQQAFKSVVNYVNPILYPELAGSVTPSAQTQAPSSAPPGESIAPVEPILPNQLPEMGGFTMSLM